MRIELGIPEATKVILGVAPDIMSEIKGGKWILELAEKLKDEDITFVLVGDMGKWPRRIKNLF